MTTPYRDDREALEQRLASLEGELARVRETLKSLGEDERTAASLEKEIAGLRAQLEDRAKRGVLEDLRIAAPCSADWGAMEGDDRVRFCGSCQKNVYDLSKLSRVEAERLVAEREGPSLCVRLYQRRDGTVITNDCPVGRKRRRLRRIVALGVVGGVVLAVPAMMMRWRVSACWRATQGAAAPTEEVVIRAGGVSFPEETSTARPAPPPAGSVGDREVHREEPAGVRGSRAR